MRWIGDFHVRELFISLSLSAALLGTSVGAEDKRQISLCLERERLLSDFATKASTYGTYEILVEDEVEHACKLMSLSDA